MTNQDRAGFWCHKCDAHVENDASADGRHVQFCNDCFEEAGGAWRYPAPVQAVSRPFFDRVRDGIVARHVTEQPPSPAACPTCRSFGWILLRPSGHKECPTCHGTGTRPTTS